MRYICTVLSAVIWRRQHCLFCPFASHICEVCKTVISQPFWAHLSEEDSTAYSVSLTRLSSILIGLFLCFIITERLYQMPCDINYHINHCYPTRFCDQAHKTGISVLHGNTLMFHKGADSVFTSVYNAFRDVSKRFAVFASSFKLYFAKTRIWQYEPVQLGINLMHVAMHIFPRFGGFSLHRMLSSNEYFFRAAICNMQFSS